MTSLVGATRCNRHAMGMHCRAAGVLTIVVLLLLASDAPAVETGDFMCDARESTAENLKAAAGTAAQHRLTG